MDKPLSVVIITKNEERNIREALISSDFADEIIVLDSGSDDRTCEIAKEHGAHVEYSAWLGYGQQKNKAVSLTNNDWVLVIDADERIPNKLKVEIQEILKNPVFHGYKIPRLNSFFGKYIKHGGLYPDYTLRLFNKKFGRFTDSIVHEKVEVLGPIGTIQNHLIHYAFSSVIDFYKTQKKYAALSVKKKSKLKAFFSPLWVFIKIYFLRFGFLDGWRGLIIAIVYAIYTFRKYAK